MALSKEEWDAARVRYESEHTSAAKIAKAIGVSGAALSQMATRHGWTRPGVNVKVNRAVKAGLNVKSEPIKVFTVKADGKIKYEKRTPEIVQAAVETARAEVRSLQLMDYQIDVPAWRQWSSQPDAIEEYCEYIMSKGIEGSMRAFCREKKFGISTLHNWIIRDPARFDRYTASRKDQGDTLFDELLGIVLAEPERAEDGKIDPGWVQWRRLIADTVKWGAAKLKPETYGDRTDLHVTGSVTTTVDRSALVSELQALAAKGIKLPMVQDVTDVEPKRLT